MAAHAIPPRIVMFLVYRYVLAEPRTFSAVSVQFALSRMETSSILRRLEAFGFIYRKRSGARKNGIVYCASPVKVGDALPYTYCGAIIKA